MNPTQDDTKALVAIYDRVAVQHDRIDDFRAKLLGFLPALTAVLIALVEKGPTHTEYLVAIGIFGALASIGLFVHELRGIIDCYMLVMIGRAIDDKLAKKADVKFGPFSSQIALEGKLNNKTDWHVSRETAACIVYSATITAWAVLAASPMLKDWPVLGPWLLTVLALVVLIGAALTAQRILRRYFRMVEGLGDRDAGRG